MEIDNNIPELFKENQAYMSLLSRVSVRRYADTAVTPDQVSAILHAAMSAPTAVNKQPWEFIVVDKPELLGQLAAALPYAKWRLTRRWHSLCAATKTDSSTASTRVYGSRICRPHRRIYSSRRMQLVWEVYGHVSIRTMSAWSR